MLFHGLVVGQFCIADVATFVLIPAVGFHARRQLAQLAEELPLDEALGQESPVGTEVHGHGQGR